LFDASAHPSRIAGEVKGFDPRLHLGPDISVKRLARQTQLALAATYEAMADAALTDEDVNAGNEIPLVLGVSSSAIDVIEHGMQRLLEHGPHRVPTHIVSACQPHQAASNLSHRLSMLTQATTMSSACAAGVDAIGMAADLIRRGKADVALCGGTDAPINPLTYACLAKAGLVSLRNDEPEKASRPFDMDRDSGVISEGAGIIVLENLDNARARGVIPYLEITGYATRTDPDVDQLGSGLGIAMHAALANAGRRPSDVDYISAHGPGHPLVDRAETAMIKAVFGRRAYAIPVSSIKGVIGNPLSAAGALQVIACALTMRHDVLPPTANLDKPDPECDLDYVPLKARRARVSCALINSHGLGGCNSCLVVERIASQ
jgi:3-oxoacyl-(acyl-carrier-protein) synthase